MLTSSNQYLRPEYLTPLPTTLDAKKSPLALLAQTCSQIGADSSNTKLTQSTDKNKTKLDGTKDSNKSIGNLIETAPKPTYSRPFESSSSSSSREKSRTPEERSSSSSSHRVRTPLAKISTPSSNRCSSNQSATSPRNSPAIGRKTPNNDSNSEDSTTMTTTPSKSGSEERSSPHAPASSSTKSNFTQSVPSSMADAIRDVPLSAYKPGALPPTSPFLGAYPPPGFPMDLMTSSLMSHHAMKAGALGPYLSYARMKTPGDLMSTCRDPYCTGCGMNAHLLGNSKTATACPAGCTQCDHATSKNANYLGHNSPAAAAYAHAQLAVLAAASHLPYVCNWISGDAAYCGKRFSSSEELLQHLRTHTSASVSEAGAASLSMSLAGGLPPTHPLLHRTYPTPPLSPLATARYHPYSKPSLLPPSLSSPLPSLPLGHPGLSPYLSPYSLYGPRLGASMHP